MPGHRSVSIMAAEIGAAAMHDPDWLARSSHAIKQMYGYWRSKCEGDHLPPRRAIDPVEIPRFLPHITIVEVVPDARRYVYRLVGTKEVEIRGRDPTGKSVLEGFFGPSLDDALSCYDTVVRTGLPHYDDTPYITPDGRFSDDETLFLPLSEDGEHISRILVFGTFSPGPKP
ncbi:MAG TPA: PAS domain-containing protein [Dongiaceae bacterium]|nr:PAS domain-containing protein [Dongiaceae bacterium]